MFLFGLLLLFCFIFELDKIGVLAVRCHSEKVTEFLCNGIPMAVHSRSPERVT